MPVDGGGCPVVPVVAGRAARAAADVGVGLPVPVALCDRKRLRNRFLRT